MISLTIFSLYLWATFFARAACGSLRADKIRDKKQEVLEVFFDAEQQFKGRLQKYTLDSLLVEGSDRVENVDWEAIVLSAEI